MWYLILGLIVCGWTLRWLNSRRQHITILLKLIQQLQNQEMAQSKDHFVVNASDLNANIIYERLGKEYTIVVPYNRCQVANMSQLRATLVYADKTSIDITQQPGIPYIYSAADLGGEYITIVNAETGLTHNYTKTTRPIFAYETMD